MHTDFAVITGAHHTNAASACQDFCLAEEHPRGAWAVVSDGCSTGAWSDLGARAWALAARQVLQRDPGAVSDLAALERTLLEYAQPALGQLRYEDGYATLGMVTALGSTVRAAFFGDGALLARKTDGSTVLVNLQFSANAPYYLNYRRPPDLLSVWEAEYPAQELLITTNLYDAQGVLVKLSTEVKAARAGGWFWAADIEQDELDLVLVATDGVCSRESGFIATGKDLLGVKSAAGTFLRRRLGKLARTWTQEHSMPTDDLAVAGIWLGPEEAT